MSAPDAGLNSAGTLGENQEVSQEDMVRVSESAKKAVMAGGQVRTDQKKNGQIALFLEFLFDEIKSDDLWKEVIDMCMRPDSLGKNMTLSVHEMIALFIPHYEWKAQELGVHDAIDHLPTWSNTMLDGYCEYVSALRKAFPHIHAMNLQKLATVTILMLAYVGVIPAVDQMPPEQYTEFLQQVMIMIQ